jgi:hypothetical protein
MLPRDLTKEEIEHLKSANRVTVGKQTQVTDNGLKDWYIPAFVGVLFAMTYKQKFRYDTPEEARKVEKKFWLIGRSRTMEKISDEKLELFAGMEPIDAVDKTVKSMASNLLQTRADLAAAREELALYSGYQRVRDCRKLVNLFWF